MPEPTQPQCPSPDPDPGTRPRARVYLFSALACSLLLALPFLLVTIPPITDLPQQTAQIRLLTEALGGDQGPYRIQWLHPNKLGYLPLAAAWWVSGPLAAGRWAMVALAVLWTAALHGLARGTGRGPGAAVLASLFFFNHTTYWGFLNALIGLPVFVLWLLLLRRRPESGWWQGPGLALTAALLYGAHVLWLAAGLIWLLVGGFVPGPGERRRPWTKVLTTTARRLAWVSPVLLALALWYPQFVAAGADPRTFPGRSVFERLHPGWLVGTLLGGLRGRIEAVLLLAVAGWLLAGLWHSRRRRVRQPDRPLLAAGLLFALAALALPEVHRHTIFFAGRWMPVAAVFLGLAIPRPRLRPLLAAAVPWLLVTTLVVTTANRWIGFERQELTGFGASLARLPAGQRLLGLDLVRTSPRIMGYPYYHLFAWGQVLRGGELNRSFADEGSSLVVFRDLPHEYPWTPGLDWRPRRLRHSDLPHFDYALIHAGEAEHARFASDPRLVPVTAAGAWRLYRIDASG